MKRIGAENRHRVGLTLNGREAGGWAEPRMLLSDFLRHELGATGTHVGCEHGVCGACTVRLDGAPVRACLTLAVQAEGRRVDTVEGLAPEGELNDLQKAFRRHHALQCGFCTPGILMSLDAYLETSLSRTKGRSARCSAATSAAARAIPGLWRLRSRPRRRGGARMTDLGRVLIAAAERNPHALAVVDGERRFDYAAWFDTVSRVAGGIGALGLRPGDRLAVIMQNRWEMAALHWACQLAGVVAVPLNWRSSADELDYFLTDSGAAALAFDGSAAAAMADSACAARLRRIEAGGRSEGTVPFADLLAAPAEAAPRAGEDDLSLMLYTSGHHRARQGRAAQPPRRACGRARPHRAELLPRRRAHAGCHAALSHHGRALPARHGAGGRRLRLPTALRGARRAPPDRGRADHRPLPGADALLRPAGVRGIRTRRYLLGAQIGFRRRADGRRPAAPGRRRLPAGTLRQPLRLVGDLHLHDRSGRRRQARLGGQGRHQPAHPGGGDRRGRSRPHRACRHGRRR